MTQHPIASKLGLNSRLSSRSELVFTANPAVTSPWHSVKVSLTEDEVFSFSVKDDQREFSASFSRLGQLISLSCSAGIPAGDTTAVVELFFEEAQRALDHLVLFH